MMAKVWGGAEPVGAVREVESSWLLGTFSVFLYLNFLLDI